jgi:hypothetical protein
MEYPNSKYKTFGEAVIADFNRAGFPFKECEEMKPVRGYYRIRKAVGEFVYKIENARKRKGSSTLVFKEGLEALA